MKYIIDRFEENVALLEDDNKNIISIPISVLPKGAVEGDCLIKQNDIYTLDKEAAEIRKQVINSLIDDLFI